MKIAGGVILSWPMVLLLYQLFVAYHGFLFSDGEVTPMDPFVFINDILTLSCGVTRAGIKGNVSASMFFIKKSGSKDETIPMEYIRVLDTRRIKLEYPVGPEYPRGPYECYMNTIDNRYLGGQTATAEYRPLPVYDFRCVVHDWKNMTCSWKPGQPYIHSNDVGIQAEIHWNTTTIGNMNISTAEALTSYTWSGHNFNYNDSMYNIMVTIVISWKRQIMDKAQSDWFVVNTNSIVKPAPVYDLTVTRKTNTCVSLTWNTWTGITSVLYRVLVLSNSHIQENNSTNRKYVNICDLKPATDYVFNVTSIPAPEGIPQGFYSTPMSVGTTTLEGVPSAPPDVNPGCFSYHDNCPFSSVCPATIYWKRLSPEVSNGQITGYLIVITDRGSGVAQEVTVEGHSSSFDHSFNTDRSYSLELKSRTEIGYSERSSLIIIPRTADRPPKPLRFRVETDMDAIYVTWERQTTPIDPKLYGHTVHHCKGSSETLKCQSSDDIQWVRLPALQLTYNTSLYDGYHDSALIGISAEGWSSNQMVSSGIVWSRCLYRANQKPTTALVVTFSPNQQDNALAIEWQTPVCRYERAYIIHYIVDYCKSGTNGCAGELKSHTVPRTEVRTQSHVITNLNAGESHRIVVRPVSVAGVGPDSQPIVKVVVFNGLSEGDLAWIIIGVLFAIVVIICFLVLCIRKIQQRKKNFLYPIEYPVMMKSIDTTENNTKPPLSLRREINNTNYVLENVTMDDSTDTQYHTASRDLKEIDIVLNLDHSETMDSNLVTNNKMKSTSELQVSSPSDSSTSFKSQNIAYSVVSDNGTSSMTWNCSPEGASSSYIKIGERGEIVHSQFNANNTEKTPTENESQVSSPSQSSTSPKSQKTESSVVSNNGTSSTTGQYSPGSSYIMIGGSGESMHTHPIANIEKKSTQNESPVSCTSSTSFKSQDASSSGLAANGMLSTTGNNSPEGNSTSYIRIGACEQVMNPASFTDSPKDMNHTILPMNKDLHSSVDAALESSSSGSYVTHDKIKDIPTGPVNSENNISPTSPEVTISCSSLK